MDRETYQDLHLTPMTKERYEALCAQYDIPVLDKLGMYINGDFGWAEYGSKGLIKYRIYQLRALTRQRENLARMQPAPVQIDTGAQAERERREMDGPTGYGR